MLIARGVVEAGEFGSVKVDFQKESRFCEKYNSFLGGHIKYLNIPAGSKVRITIELLDEGKQQ